MISFVCLLYRAVSSSNNKLNSFEVVVLTLSGHSKFHQIGSTRNVDSGLPWIRSSSIVKKLQVLKDVVNKEIGWRDGGSIGEQMVPRLERLDKQRS